jgi:transcriptional regulator GlxA family with amidase domain
MTSYGLLIFDGAEELDFTGPWEVFTASAMLRDGADTAMLIAERSGPVRCNKGMRVLPDHTLDDHPPLDVLLVPGGNGTRREVANPAITGWIGKTAETAAWTTSVHAFEDTLAARGDITVVRDARYVVDGNLVTSQGVSAGIDMALWLVGRLHGRDHARAVRRYIQYDPAPPYLADEPPRRLTQAEPRPASVPPARPDGHDRRQPPHKPANKEAADPAGRRPGV